ncbi:MAG TPA: hypothetical protein PK746_03445, partial [Spirochaetales bacterium]|nr:hypothetical protein [Spirochaetales bacterium]
SCILTNFNKISILYSMTVYEQYLVFPDGDTQEIEHSLSIDAIVDVNGIPLSANTIAQTNLMYRVYKIQKQEKTGSCTTFYYLEQLSIYDVTALRHGI